MRMWIPFCSSCYPCPRSWSACGKKELEPELQQEVLEFWFTVRDFLNMADRLSDNYVIYSELDVDGPSG